MAPAESHLAVEENTPARLCQPSSSLAFKNKAEETLIWNQESCSDSALVNCVILSKQHRDITIEWRKKVVWGIRMYWKHMAKTSLNASVWNQTSLLILLAPWAGHAFPSTPWTFIWTLGLQALPSCQLRTLSFSRYLPAQRPRFVIPSRSVRVLTLLAPVCGPFTVY